MTQLEHITDIINLDIRSLNSLSQRRKKYWGQVEKKVNEKYNAPSIQAYLLYEYHFNKKSGIELAKELGVSHNASYNLMRDLGIPIRTISETITPERKERLIGFKRGKTLEDIYGLEKGREMRQRMSETTRKAMEQTRTGRIYEEIYGIERAKEIKKKMSLAHKRSWAARKLNKNI